MLLHVLADFMDDFAGGDLLQNLERASELEIILPDSEDRMIIRNEVSGSKNKPSCCFGCKCYTCKLFVCCPTVLGPDMLW